MRSKIIKSDLEHHSGKPALFYKNVLYISLYCVIALFTAPDPTAESVPLYSLQYTPCSSTGFPVPLFENKKSEKGA